MHRFLVKMTTSSFFRLWRFIFWRNTSSFDEFVTHIFAYSPASIDVIYVNEDDGGNWECHLLGFRRWFEMSFQAGIFRRVVFVHNKTKNLYDHRIDPKTIEVMVEKAKATFCATLTSRFSSMRIDG